MQETSRQIWFRVSGVLSSGSIIIYKQLAKVTKLAAAAAAARVTKLTAAAAAVLL